ncbi:serine/threonine-protein kinase RIO3-like [Dreissena polymorpha]|uniref:Serine/threonine-protein kinase RIO3 n=1 Tax=Dreissena polymorpha TaxID=45954 RepID=A0A9D4NNM6_DREPO|nr:serine/threonine-protein kinase RIO3-like [Dreissena polymorpha]XP_052260101.1 serine/threonine-protein kinase RIO3-like [Dreissena polymorpha]KAH3896944.1 hypothetical protein DPMN_021128 [Dreissena polymorpha]
MEGIVAEGHTQTLVKPSPWGKAVQSSPWGQSTNQNAAPCSLEEVMSEQLASELQQEEDKTCGFPEAAGVDVEPEIQELIEAANSEGDTSSDVVLARMLQMQYDQEHNQLLQAQESHLNKCNTVKVSFEKYKLEYPAFSDDEKEDSQCFDDEYENKKTEWEKSPVVASSKGYSGRGKNIVTKHDAVICGRKNASKMMDFTPEFESGDCEEMDMRLPNNVYNHLKRHSNKADRRQQKLHEKKEHSTAEHAMDPRTRLLLYKLVNSGTLESISGSISTGKESVVLHAYGGRIEGRTLATEVAIKVFKTTLSEFKTREKYVHGDHRFSKDDYKKQNPRKIIKMWAMKECANLGRMHKFNIPCPVVQIIKKHVLVMTFIGEDRKPAPKLKHAKLSAENIEDAYDQVVKIMRKMYLKCGLVHADLSEYNMLWHADTVWIIDVSQAVYLDHPRALEFLYRDSTNVVNFFSESGAHAVMTPEQLFNKVTDLDIRGQGSDFIAQVQRYAKEKSQELIANEKSDKNYAFDYFFDKSVRDKSNFDTLIISDSDSEEDDEDVDDEVCSDIKEEGYMDVIYDTANVVDNACSDDNNATAGEVDNLKDENCKNGSRGGVCEDNEAGEMKEVSINDETAQGSS